MVGFFPKLFKCVCVGIYFLFAGERGQTVRLICIPEFSSSYTAVVLNLRNLDCAPITFS